MQHEKDDVGSSNGSNSVPQALQGQAVEPTRVRYSYYTAGSGGVGPTILETSFLLAGQEVVVFADGKKVSKSAQMHHGPNCVSAAGGAVHLSEK